MSNELERRRLLRLIHRTAAEDSDAFQRLYEHTASHVFGVLRQMLGSDAQAEEVLQEVYLAVWSRAGDFHVSRGTVMTWIITIARRKAIDLIRRRKREVVTDEVPELPTDEQDSPLNMAMAGNHAEQLRICIDELTLDQRHCVELAFFNGATHREVSNAISKPVGTVKSWIRRGLSALKRCLER